MLTNWNKNRSKIKSPDVIRVQMVRADTYEDACVKCGPIIHHHKHNR